MPEMLIFDGSKHDLSERRSVKDNKIGREEILAIKGEAGDAIEKQEKEKNKSPSSLHHSKEK